MMIHAATARVHASQNSVLVDRQHSEAKGDDDDLRYLEGSPGPSTSLRLRLSQVMEQKKSEMPDSPHKCSPTHGNEFCIFLRFKGRTRLAKWQSFDTAIDLQQLFLDVFNFPEKSLHVFLLNKARLEVVRDGIGKRRKKPVLFSVLSQLHPGVIIEAHSDVWEAWFKHAKGGGKLMKRLSVNPRLLQQSMSLPKRIDIFMNEPESNKGAFYFSLCINFLIFLSSLTFIIETLPFFHDDRQVKGFLGVIEAICVSAFTLELAGRFVVSQDYSKFVRNTMNVIDFVAILPFYLQLFASDAPIPGLSILRLLRLARVLRLFKVMKTFMSVLSGTVSSSSTPLVMLTLFLSITTIVFSSVLYYAERGTYDEDLEVWRRKIGYVCPYVCPQADHYLGCGFKGHVVDVFSTIKVGKFKDQCQRIYEQSPFDSIIATFWVVTQTMTVVGYGDTEIISELGKFIGTCSVLTGILALALPISIIETNFSREMAIFRKKALFIQIQRRIKRDLKTEGSIWIPK